MFIFWLIESHKSVNWLILALHCVAWCHCVHAGGRVIFSGSFSKSKRKQKIGEFGIAILKNKLKYDEKAKVQKSK